MQETTVLMTSRERNRMDMLIIIPLMLVLMGVCGSLWAWHKLINKPKQTKIIKETGTLVDEIEAWLRKQRDERFKED